MTLANGITALFRVTGVREYAKSRFPTKAIYGATDYAALRLITCGGTFDYATSHYLSSTIVFASLTSSRAARGRGGGDGVCNESGPLPAARRAAALRSRALWSSQGEPGRDTRPVRHKIARSRPQRWPEPVPGEKIRL